MDCRECCRSTSAVATLIPIPVINPDPGNAWGNAIKTALAAMTGVMHYDPSSGHWLERGAPFTFGSDTYRFAIVVQCDDLTVHGFTEKLIGGVWFYNSSAGFGTGGGGTVRTATCCVESWNKWQDLETGNADHDETLTVTWTGNKCCRDGDGNCVHADGDCSGDCTSSSSGDPCVVWKAHYNCGLAVWETEISDKTCDDPLVASAAMDTWVRDGTTCDWYLKRLQSGGIPTPTHPASNESCCP